MSRRTLYYYTSLSNANCITYSISAGSDILLGIVVVIDELGSELIKGLERDRDRERERERERAWLKPMLSSADP